MENTAKVRTWLSVPGAVALLQNLPPGSHCSDPGLSLASIPVAASLNLLPRHLERDMKWMIAMIKPPFNYSTRCQWCTPLWHYNGLWLPRTRRERQGTITLSKCSLPVTLFPVHQLIFQVAQNRGARAWLTRAPAWSDFGDTRIQLILSTHDKSSAFWNSLTLKRNEVLGSSIDISWLLAGSSLGKDRTRTRRRTHWCLPGSVLFNFAAADWAFTRPNMLLGQTNSEKWNMHTHACITQMHTHTHVYALRCPHIHGHTCMHTHRPRQQRVLVWIW